MAVSDSEAVCVCRDHIPPEMIAELDEWIPKHFDDSLLHPAVTGARSYRVLWGLPPTFTDEGCRLIIYRTRDMEGLVEWLDSPELRAAIQRDLKIEVVEHSAKVAA